MSGRGGGGRFYWMSAGAGLEDGWMDESDMVILTG